MLEGFLGPGAGREAAQSRVSPFRYPEVLNTKGRFPQIPTRLLRTSDSTAELHTKAPFPIKQRTLPLLLRQRRRERPQRSREFQWNEPHSLSF